MPLRSDGWKIVLRTENEAERLDRIRNPSRVKMGK